MCGIIAFAERGSVAPHLIKGLERLEYRGYDSAGLAVMSDSVIRTCKTTKRVAELEAKYNSAPFYGSVGIGHTRWATHGAPTERNAHPHLSEDGHFAVVHNGIIENYAELKAFLIGKGYTFTSETDSEVAVQLIDYYYDGDPMEAVRLAEAQFVGSYAIRRRLLLHKARSAARAPLQRLCFHRPQLLPSPRCRIRGIQAFSARPAAVARPVYLQCSLLFRTFLYSPPNCRFYAKPPAKYIFYMMPSDKTRAKGA